MKLNPFKRSFLLLILLALASGFSLAEEEKKEEEQEKTDEQIELEKKEALEKRLAAEQEVKIQFGYTFNTISDKLVTISCSSERGRSSGSGFTAVLDGKTYLFTNQHVIFGADTIAFKAASGKTLRPRGVEFSTSRDIVRLLLPEGTDGFEIGAAVETNDLVGVFGNSEGGGVATELYGKVIDVEPEVFEVSTDFVSGNSGSPVLNLEQEAIGIATYVRFEYDDEVGDKTQRYCYRLAGNRWRPVNWKKYNEKYGKQFRESEQLVESTIEIIDAWSDAPDRRMTADQHPDSELRKWAVEHNRVVNRFTRMRDKKAVTSHELHNTNKRLQQDMVDSAESLSSVCRSRARQMRLLAQQRDLTGWLRNQFESLAERLERVAESIDDFSVELGNFKYFYFR